MPEQAVEQGDAFDLLAGLPDDYAHAAVVDYPWQFEAQNGTGRFQNNGSRGFDVYQTEDHERLSDVFRLLSDVLEDGGWVFVFADDDTSPQFRELLEASPLTYRRTCVWDREKFGMGTYHRVQHYPILTATNGDTDRYIKGRGTVYKALKHDGPVAANQRNDYPTGKPPELYRQILAPPVLEGGDRLLEPFCGSGPGAAVAASRGLDYWGCDVSDDAVERTRGHYQQSRLMDL